MLLVKDCSFQQLSVLLAKYKLSLELTEINQPIPGSFWGDAEAGLVNNTLYVRADTPVHSLLHETCHYICMDDSRRRSLHTDAAGDYDEENAVCYLQIILADHITGMGKQRMMRDMDDWGYTFRLGSAKAWFNKDAEDALQWLLKHRIINAQQQPKFTLRD